MTADPSAAPAAPAPKPNRRPLIIIGAVALAAAVWGGVKYVHGLSHVETDNAQVEGHITPIAPKVSGFVAEVRVDNNQTVKASDTLLVLDDRDYRVRLAQATADLAAARAQAGSNSRAGQAQAQYEGSRASAASAAAAVVASEANLRKAASDLQRLKGLAAQQIVSAQQLDAAQAAFDAATANLEALRRQQGAAENNVQAAQAALSVADARLAAAQAAVDNARLQLGYTRITSPVDGVVAKRSVEAGELVQAGQDLMSVVPLGDVWVTANLKETELENVTPGDKAGFTVDAYPGHAFHGHVESISPATGASFALIPPDNATGNFTKVVQRVPVKILLDDPVDPARPLRPGMSVVVSITTK